MNPILPSPYSDYSLVGAPHQNVNYANSYLESLYTKDSPKAELVRDLFNVYRVIDAWGVVRNPIFLNQQIPELTSHQKKRIRDFYQKLFLNGPFINVIKEIDQLTFRWLTVGSLVPYLLGFDYFQTIFERFGIPISADSIYAPLLQEATAPPHDIDVRGEYVGTHFTENLHNLCQGVYQRSIGTLLNIVQRAKTEIPNVSFEEIEKKLSDASKKFIDLSPQEFEQILNEQINGLITKEKEIAHKALQELSANFLKRTTKSIAPYWIDDFDGHMVHMTTKGRLEQKEFKIDLSLVRRAKRRHLVSSDNWRLDTSAIFRETKAPLRPEGDFKFINPWQTAVDRVLGIDRLDDIDSLNEYGCARLLANKTKGHILLGFNGETTQALQGMVLQRLLSFQLDLDHLISIFAKIGQHNFAPNRETYTAYINDVRQIFAPACNEDELQYLTDGLEKAYLSFEFNELWLSETANDQIQQETPKIVQPAQPHVKEQVVAQQIDENQPSKQTEKKLYDDSLSDLAIQLGVTLPPKPWSNRNAPIQNASPIIPAKEPVAAVAQTVKRNGAIPVVPAKQPVVAVAQKVIQNGAIPAVSAKQPVVAAAQTAKQNGAIPVVPAKQPVVAAARTVKQNGAIPVVPAKQPVVAAAQTVKQNGAIPAVPAKPPVVAAAQTVKQNGAIPAVPAKPPVVTVAQKVIQNGAIPAKQPVVAVAHTVKQNGAVPVVPAKEPVVAVAQKVIQNREIPAKQPVVAAAQTVKQNVAIPIVPAKEPVVAVRQGRRQSQAQNQVSASQKKPKPKITITQILRHNLTQEVKAATPESDKVQAKTPVETAAIKQHVTASVMVVAIRTIPQALAIKKSQPAEGNEVPSKKPLIDKEANPRVIAETAAVKQNVTASVIVVATPTIPEALAIKKSQPAESNDVPSKRPFVDKETIPRVIAETAAVKQNVTASVIVVAIPAIPSAKPQPSESNEVPSKKPLIDKEAIPRVISETAIPASPAFELEALDELLRNKETLPEALKILQMFKFEEPKYWRHLLKMVQGDVQLKVQAFNLWRSTCKHQDRECWNLALSCLPQGNSEALRWMVQVRGTEAMGREDLQLFKLLLNAPDCLNEAVHYAQRLISVKALRKPFKELFSQLLDRLKNEKVDEKTLAVLSKMVSDSPPFFSTEWQLGFFQVQGLVQESQIAFYTLSKNAEAKLIPINFKISADFLRRQWKAEKLRPQDKVVSLNRVSPYISDEDLAILWPEIILENLESAKGGSIKEIKAALTVLREQYHYVPILTSYNILKPKINKHLVKQDRKIIAAGYELIIEIIANHEKCPPEFVEEHFLFTKLLADNFYQRVTPPQMPIFALPIKNLEPSRKLQVYDFVLPSGGFINVFDAGKLTDITTIYFTKIFEANFVNKDHKTEMLLRCSTTVFQGVNLRVSAVESYVRPLERDYRTYPAHFKMLEAVLQFTKDKWGKETLARCEFLLTGTLKNPTECSIQNLLLQTLDSSSSFSIWSSFYRFIDNRQTLIKEDRVTCIKALFDAVSKQGLKPVLLPDIEELQKQGLNSKLIARVKEDQNLTLLDVATKVRSDISPETLEVFDAEFAKTIHKLVFDLLKTGKSVDIWRAVFLLRAHKDLFKKQSEALLFECLNKILVTPVSSSKLKLVDFESFKSIPKIKNLNLADFKKIIVSHGNYEVKAVQSLPEEYLVNTMIRFITEFALFDFEKKSDYLSQQRQLCVKLMDWLESLIKTNGIPIIVNSESCLVDLHKSGLFTGDEATLISLYKRAVHILPNPTQEVKKILQVLQKGA